MSQLRIGVIGVSGRGRIADGWHQPEGRSLVVAGADVYPERLEQFRQKYDDDVFTTLDYRELVSRDDIDAVAVTSPDFCHEEHACAALEAGKHVFCEKPLAITIEGCDRILETQRQSGKRMMVGFNMRYMNVFRVMKEAVDSGAIGEVRAVWVRHFVGRGGSWYFHDWHATQKQATSLLLQKGSHDIDMIHWITGQYTKRVVAMGSLDFYGGDRDNDLTCPECPDKRTCTEVQEPEDRRQQCCFRKEIDVEDNSLVLMELENGIKASYLQCHYTPDYFRNYVFVGTEGRIENTSELSEVRLKTRKGNHWRNLADRTYDVKPATGGHGGSDSVITEDFLDMIIEGKEPVSPIIAGRMSVATGVKAAESLRNGSIPLDIPPPA